ncbi:MAG: rRNA pseudouridine synthase [Verrucomicrobiae bacterium]|nr:rRNA pseudouridine synthase [Verrucomicrobiae bacterium]
MLVRLQKYLASAGIDSRRGAEELILSGRVSVNGEVCSVLGTKIDPEKDEVAVDGLEVKPKKKVYIALHKPPGYICTRKDPEERKTIYYLLPHEWNNLYTVGRLDRASEGLIFLTNDGDFCLKLTHPRYGIAKTYIVTVWGRVEKTHLEKICKGVYHSGERLRVLKARLISANNTNSIVEVELNEGKNREVRRIFEAIGFDVKRLVRTKIGNIKLGELPSGKWRKLTNAEIKYLLSEI